MFCESVYFFLSLVILLHFNVCKNGKRLKNRGIFSLYSQAGSWTRVRRFSNESCFEEVLTQREARYVVIMTDENSWKAW